MFRNYITVAFRSLLKNKTYSFINVFGLSVGIATSLIILLYVVHEVSFDKFHHHRENIHRIIGKINYGGQIIETTAVSVPFGPILKNNNAEVENYVRVRDAGRVLIQSDETHTFFENKVAFADTSFFSVFSFPLTEGSYTSLARPSTGIITESAAKKYFGTSQVVGRTIVYQKKYPIELVGVAKNFPSNSTLQYDFIFSFNTLGQFPEEQNAFQQTTASLGSIATYVLVNPDDIKKVESSIPTFVKASVDEKYKLEKFANTHLGNNFRNSSNITYLYLFGTVALVILALALVNYMNLTTARASTRGKEVGVRKVIGARFGNLATQFYFESALTTVLAFALAWVWIELALPVFVNTLQIQIDTSFLTTAWFLILTAVLFIACWLLAGSYPSAVLSKFKPIEVLKGKSSMRRGTWVRKGFTVFQFATSIALILITMGIQHQLNFLRDQKIGLNKEQVMVVNLDETSAKHYNALKNDLRNISGISQVAAASIPLYTRGHNALFTKTPHTNEDVFISTITIDENFISLLGIEWLEKPDTIAKDGYIINEAALSTLKITKNEIGQKIEGRPINGIIKNFNYETLRQDIRGLLLSVVTDTTSALTQHGASLYLRIDPKANLFNKIASIQSAYKKYEGNRPFEYYFLDDAFHQLYKSEDRLSQIFNSFTVIAIFIACLGLFGLITFIAETRTKEIGIRKVLGASIRNIMLLLSKEFIWLTIIAACISIPLGWWYLGQWTQQFSYRAQMPWWFAATSVALAAVIWMLTIAGQAVRTALTNPVDSLRSE